MYSFCQYLKVTEKWIAIGVLLLTYSCGSSINIGSVDEYQKQEVNNTMQELKDSLTLKLNEIAKRSERLGFGVAILDKDSVYYQEAFGKISKETGKDFTLNTVMPIGSVSKTLAGISIMKAVELGYLNLEDDINQYLNFKIVNPFHPNKRITIKQLTTHTSTLKYTRHYDNAYLFDRKIPPIYNDLKGKRKRTARKEIEGYNDNVAMTMEDFVKKIYTEGGEWYNKKNFLSNVPGEKFSYCNENAALAALVIEGATNTDFQSFVKQHIIEVTGLTQSSWLMSKYKPAEKGQLYMFSKPIPDYHLITYPDGGFVTNTIDLTKYLQDLIRGYFGEENMLSPKSYEVLFREHHREEEEAAGIFMELSGNQIGHNGGDPGISTFMYFDKRTSFGYVLIFKYGISMALFDTLKEVRKHCAYFSNAKK